MAKLTRYVAKVFGSTAGASQMATFGSLAAGTPDEYSGTTITPDLVQALSEFESGWYSAVQGQNSPTIQDTNALHYLHSYQNAYILEMGIGEWNSATTYYIGSLVNSAGVVYQSQTDTNLNNAVTSTTNWTPISGVSSRNLLINGALDFWQRGTTVTVANGVSTYLADRFYVNNALGASGVITYSQVTGTSTGSLYGASVKVSTAPSVAGSSGLNFVQVLDNITTQQIYNGKASFQANVKALGNVTQVTLALVYATTEIKPTLSNIITSVTATVNSSGFVVCQLPNVSVGTSATTSGVVAVLIYASAVSSGHVTDLNNGFVVEQLVLNKGTACSSFQRAGANSEEELAMCQRFYEKSYDINVAPGTGSVGASAVSAFSDISSNLYFFVSYRVSKRTGSGTISFWTAAGTANNWSISINGAGFSNTVVTGNIQPRVGGFQTIVGAGGAGQGAIALACWASDAEI